ncbi:hypothetical protein ACJ73_05520 [Blastomyces percursus]|uniref:G-protein coupled receptors family 2 profile 2 domain-containing protein n=1 Tax=Blastomyces percursus TaxID=1658174 RepID=A0A1J9R538_9EURO|nr:hypothetical protein ACJ73_05520 [Blastomyces percursus]
MLSRSQIHAIEASVRAMSAVSVTSSFFVIASFLWSKLFQTPVNRLMFYATWGNVLANVGTIIGGAGISHGSGSSLCRCQAFLLQWFLPTNALWILCMAINVYLTTSHKYRPSELKRLEWRYFIMCYGVPLIPAFAFLFVETKASGPVYGAAVIWCWIRPEWQAFRFAFFYGPIWLTIVMTIAILLYHGIEINSKRMKIKKFSVDAVHDISDKHHQSVRRDTATSVQMVAPSPSIVARRADDGPGNASTFESPPSSGDVRPLGGDTGANDRTPSRTDLSTRETPEKTAESTRSDINNGQIPSRKPSALTPGPTFCATGAAEDESRSNYEQHGTPVSSGTTDAGRNDLGLDELENLSASSSAPTAYAHLRSSHGGASSLAPTQTSSLSQNRIWSTSRPILRFPQTVDRHAATYLYMKRVSLFFLSLLITWTPSTINRIHRVSSPDDPIFGLALLSAVVVSLQGFWNLVVYISTSFDAVKVLCAACRVKLCSYTEVGR